MNQDDLADTSLDVTFGRALATLRHRRGITQAELARRCEVKAATIGMIEGDHRRPSAKLLDRIADGLALDDEARGYLVDMLGRQSQGGSGSDAADARVRILKDPLATRGFRSASEAAARHPLITGAVTPPGSRVRATRSVRGDVTLVRGTARKVREELAGSPKVLASMCPRGHANPPGRTWCGCGAQVEEAIIRRTRPALGRLCFSNGTELAFVRDIAIGRDASKLLDEAEGCRPLVFDDPQLSKHHLDVVAQGWEVYLVDWSSNGTSIRREDQDDTEEDLPLERGRYYPLEFGFEVRLTDELSFTFRPQDY